MSQRLDLRTLSVKLLPMSVSDPPPIGEATLATWETLKGMNTPHVPSLCLCPGEVGELLVRLDYDSEQPLNYCLRLDGDLPTDWYTLPVNDGLVLRRGTPTEDLVRFCPDRDFFETRQTLNPEQTFQLDYNGEVRVHALTETGEMAELLTSEPFCLFLRPRSLYPQFLPAVYREVDFIGRFLKIFEQSFEPTVQMFQTLWAYLDPLTAPEALLPFLAQWVGWQNEASWSVKQQRSLIRRAMEIYRWRGTKWGLQLYLHLYTGLPLSHPLRPLHNQPIQIHEAFQQGFVLGNSDLGPTTLLGSGKPFHFTVRLCPEPGQFLDQALVHAIIEQEKPAFCTYELEIVPIEESTYD